MSGSVKDLKSKEELAKALSEGSPVILHFWASWCEASKHMDQVFVHLSTDFPNTHFFRVEAEEQPEISESYSVSAVPYFVFCKDGKVVGTLEGANPLSLANKVAKVAGASNVTETAAPVSLGMAAGASVLESVKELAKENDHPTRTESTKSGLSNSLKECIQKLVNSHPVILFMKGSPEQPKCGFSRKVVDILKLEGIEFGSFDILIDNEVREGMKEFSGWPTFPQLFCKGELLGGCDIVLAMHESGELKEVFIDHGIQPTSNGSGKVPTQAEVSQSAEGGISDTSGLNSALTSQLNALINSNPVMLFMKGSPEEPRCGFSRKVVEILQQEKVAFGSFNVLADDEVRQGLKTLSNWSSYPQLYIKGELVGGSDIVLEMQKSGELQKLLIEMGICPKQTLEDRLKNLISAKPTMLFMKGTPDSPCCGFSSKVVNALKAEGVPFGFFDILTDEEVRQGLKTFSNWPTFPQLYHKGELIGGCDIVLEMQSNGELKSTLLE